MRDSRPNIWVTNSILFLLSVGAGPLQEAGAAYIVQEGQPRAEIVISTQALPIVQLAASELQTNVFRMGEVIPALA